MLVRRFVVRATRALQALSDGEATPDAALVRAFAGRAAVAAAGAFLTKGDDGRWHLTARAKELGARGLQAIGELAKVKDAGGHGSAIDLAGLDLNQLLAAGVQLVPPKHRGIAAIGVGLAERTGLLDMLRGLLRGGKKTSESGSSGENPFLKELGR